MKWTYDRLLEILRSIPGASPTRCALRDAARTFDRKLAKSHFMLERLRKIASNDESPHYRELAKEALQWMEMENPNG